MDGGVVGESISSGMVVDAAAFSGTVYCQMLLPGIIGGLGDGICM